MKIGSISEDLNLEKRISITPSIAKKITELGLKIFINENYAEHLGINDEDYNESLTSYDKKLIIPPCIATLSFTFLSNTVYEDLKTLLWFLRKGPKFYPTMVALILRKFRPAKVFS